jgi:DNA-binding IclR family transcriptional regulator
MSENGRAPGRGVIPRVISILESFSSNHRELSLNELSRASGLPTSTVHRMVTELVAAGALERGRAGGYRIGLRLWEVGEQAHSVQSAVSVVAPFMQDLYEVAHENVQFAILDGHEALFIEKLFGPRSARVRSTRGGRLPLHATGVGKVLLAHAPRELLDEVVDAGLERFTAYTLVTGRALERALADVRRNGLAYNHEEMDLGLVSVAAPLHDSTGTVVGALSIVGRLTRYQLRQLAPAVRTAAASASRELHEAGLRGIGRESILRLLKETGPAASTLDDSAVHVPAPRPAAKPS